MNPQHRHFRFAILFGAFLFSSAFAAGDDVLGTWLTGDKDGWVEVTRKDNGLSGKITGSPNDDPDRSTVDDKNPDPELRDRELIGLEILTGFEFDGKDKWKGGTIYDPNSGKTYKCIITIVDKDTLKVRGYIGFSLIGRTETWTRKQEQQADGEN